jgi:hypothetical protein
MMYNTRNIMCDARSMTRMSAFDTQKGHWLLATQQDTNVRLGDEKCRGGRTRRSTWVCSLFRCSCPLLSVAFLLKSSQFGWCPFSLAVISSCCYSSTQSALLRFFDSFCDTRNANAHVRWLARVVQTVHRVLLARVLTWPSKDTIKTTLTGENCRWLVFSYSLGLVRQGLSESPP